MKITPEHFDQLVSMLADYPLGRTLDEYLAAGLTAKRWRWDRLWAVDSEERTAWFDAVYSYANDDHIDTALRRICGGAS